MKIILTFLLLLVSCALRAQIIIYDNEAKRYGSYNSSTGVVSPIKSDPPILLKGSSVSYWLVNVNPFAQKVEINGRLISLTTTMPDQLAMVFSIKAEAEKALNNTQDQVVEMAEVKRSSSNGKMDSTMDQLVNACKAYYQEANNIEEALALHERLAETITNSHFYNDSVMLKALDDRRINRAAIADLRTNFENFENAYYTVYTQYSIAIDKAHAATNNGNEEVRIASAQEQVEKDYHVLEDKYAKTLASIDDLFAKATDPSSYIVKSDPIKLAGNGENADEVEFTVKVGERSFDDTFPVKGGWKVDYSVGPAFNFISDHQYFKDTDNVLQRANKGTYLSTITPSIAAMMHVCPRTAKEYTFGWMFGVNAGFKELTDIDLGFLGGVSAILGRSQKAIVSTGLSYLKVNRLKESQYTVGKAYPEVKIEDVTESVLRPSWFIAVSLNLGKRNIVKPIP